MSQLQFPPLWEGQPRCGILAFGRLGKDHRFGKAICFTRSTNCQSHLETPSQTDTPRIMFAPARGLRMAHQADT